MRQPRRLPDVLRRADPFRLACSAFVALLAGCAHDPIDTPVNWVHQIEGGEIARLRPPPPGVNDPYPHVGLTPTTRPQLPSPQNRVDITEALIEQRNYTHLLDARSGPLVVVPTVTPAAPSPARQPTASASFDAANMDGGSSDAGTQQALAPGAAPPARPVPSSARANPGETAMPALNTDVVKSPTDAQAAANVPLPQIPPAPPPAPQFPGFEVASDSAIADATRPAYALAEPPGTLVRFQMSTDIVASGQESTLADLVARGRTQSLTVHGYGSAEGVAPADQARATRLGLLRAQALVNLLVGRGVPLAHIRVMAEAFGHDARVT
ncbi:hypothetical protein KGY14_10685 [Ameyamaea chiangmaiensis]|nr:hypothetical protein [Ameyamaea chiangmaiensis]MBS4075656.1 hypothetical protein [Ameyamaea chiangmaiensis]